MSLGTLPNNERLQQLLADEATEGLARGDKLELDRLLRQNPNVDRDGFHWAAAALMLAFGGLRHVILSDTLQRRLAQSGEVALTEPRPQRTSTTAWWFAAAASVLALIGWFRPPTALMPELRSPNEQRAALINTASDLVRGPWASELADYNAVQGEVVWSDQRQRGFVTLQGLPANEPSQKQYQLWIVDPTRAAQPVDGGVFNVSDQATETVVAVDAKLAVQTPRAFAITLEQSGGVVVSDGPLLVVATLP